MDMRLTFDQLAEGRTWVSSARTITETDVVNFANMTGDMNPLHVDRVFAETTPWRRPVAHGLLGLSWAAGLGSQCPAVDTVAFLAVRAWEFTRPLFIGDTIHVRTTVAEKQAAAKRTGRVLWKLELINQDHEIAQHGSFETLVRVARKDDAPHFRPRPHPGIKQSVDQ